jgi:hypothetical protein
VSLTASAPSAQYHAQDRGRSVLHHAEIVDGHLVVRRLGPGGWREAWPLAIGRGLAREWPAGTCATALRALGVRA